MTPLASRLGSPLSERETPYAVLHTPEDQKVVPTWIRAVFVVPGRGSGRGSEACSLHDAISSERIGTPALGVMTNKFVSAAELMAKV